MSVQIYVGDCRDVLKRFADGSFNACITSPPYWGRLRDYKTPPLVWGGDPECLHDWRDASYRPAGHTDASEASTLQGGKRTQSQTQRGVIEQAWCAKCRAWLGNLGHEPTPEMYVEHLVGILREVRRVLHPEGTLWLNLGDCYVSRPQADNYADPKAPRRSPDDRCRANVLKPKDLVGIPWRVALALQADGWWLRSDIVWHKPNCMPESVRDRPTKAHEYLFLLAKSERYYYDADAVREPMQEWNGQAATFRRNGSKREQAIPGQRHGTHRPDRNDTEYHPAGRNRRTVWEIPTVPYSEAHFATFPPGLVEPCIKAGTSEYGVCAACGAPWERTTEKRRAKRTRPRRFGQEGNGDRRDTLRLYEESEVYTTGWKPTCECGATDVVPAMVLDPFAGAGTTGLAADRLGRDAVLVELNPAYAGGLAAGRIEADAGMFADVSVVSHRVEV